MSQSGDLAGQFITPPLPIQQFAKESFKKILTSKPKCLRQPSDFLIYSCNAGSTLVSNKFKEVAEFKFPSISNGPIILKELIIIILK
jgi:hypothetical protein